MSRAKGKAMLMRLEDVYNTRKNETSKLDYFSEQYCWLGLGELVELKIGQNEKW